MDDRTRSDEGDGKAFDSKTFERMCLEMFEQSIICICLFEDPFVKVITVYFITKILPEFFLEMPLEHYFRRFKALEKFIGIFAVALCYQEFSSRNIEEGKTKLFFVC